VVTDSACSLPPQLARDNEVVVVPMWVTLGGQQYRDGELGMDQVLGRLGEGMSTSGPAPGELAQAAAGADEGDGTIILTISRRMSGVYDAARLAASTLEGKRVAVVDTGTAAGAEGLVVLAAAKAARSGMVLEGVVAAAREAAQRAKLVATLPSLEHLAQGGRVPGAAAWGARWLGLNPVFEFRDGKVRPLRPARGRRAACQRIVAAWARDADHELARGSALHVAALHALEPAIAEELLAEVTSRALPVTAFVGSFSPVMVAHTGPGLVGLAWWWEPPPV
jgi:DegV family protein with EDD domain